MKIRTVVAIVTACVLVAGSVLGCLFYSGRLIFNNPSQKQYPAQGVDVSSYQGEIDWNAITCRVRPVRQALNDYLPRCDRTLE